MSVFSVIEREYLDGQRLGRLATVGADGAPHVVPVSFAYNGSLDTIDIGGHALADSKKWRDIGRDPRVAFVIDDLLPPWRPRMVEIRGQASRLGDGGASLGPGFADELIRITPTRIVSFGLDGTRDLNARNVGSVADQP
ncbi:MAG: PPOX class F420-dependent oxidoreductase [Candidatus Limnocylindrales bacterium]|nr:PPOX class F420-dependent oxidoreductase [Candidatus Limnocylindrales bacterium]